MPIIFSGWLLSCSSAGVELFPDDINDGEDIKEEKPVYIF